MAKLITVDDIIRRLGGVSAIAAELQLRPSAVSNWKKAGAFPPGRAKALAKMAGWKRMLDITVSVILDARAGPPASRRKAGGERATGDSP